MSEHHSIAVVVSPLSSLMKDQVRKVAFVAKDQKDEQVKEDVISGHYSLVYMTMTMSLESMLTNNTITERCFDQVCIRKISSVSP